MQLRGLIENLKRSSLFKDSFWSLTGNALGKGLALLASIAVARFLGSEEYGAYGLIKGTLVSIAIFSSFGLGYTATKFIAESLGNTSSIIPRLHRYNTIITLLASGFIGVLVVIFARPIAIWLDDESLAGILQWSSIGIVFNALITTQIGELAGFNAYKTIAKNNIVSGVATFLFVTPAAYFGGLTYAVIALIFTLLINCIINWISLKKLISPLPGNKADSDNRLLKEIISFSIPIALQESLYSVTSWGGMALLVKMADYAELGVYSASNQWMSVMLFIPGALRNVALSHLSQNVSDDKLTDHITKRLLAVNFVSTFIPFLVILLLSPWIADFYGDSYTNLPSVLNICVFTAVITSLSNVITQEFIAKNQNWYLFWTRFARDVLTLVIAYVLLLRHWIGAAESFALSWLAMQVGYLILLLIQRKKLYKV